MARGKKYLEALAAKGRVAAARTSAQVAESTLSTTRAQAQAGVTDELTYRSAELSAIGARAALARAEADVSITHARLARALQQPLDGELAPSGPPARPQDTIQSPWLDAQRAEVRAAKLDTLTAWEEVLPTASISATRPIGVVTDTWTTELQLRGDLDGGVAPFLEAREKSLARQAREIELDALERDLRLGVEVAKERAGDANVVAEAARAREQLADSSVTLAQTRLAAGVARPLEVLRLQDDAATARIQRVDAELEAALATLEARRLAGLPWGTP
jgi:outer membrane protein TolC